jgi:cyclopropane fatty-acyl-phospholipid synthase-like methyltransferase
VEYDERYAKVRDLFGAAPETILVRFADRLKPGAVVLDIGAGQGRNARFLAARGCTVHALEPSRVAAAALDHVTVFCSRFERFEPPVPAYDGILVFGLIPDLDPDSIRTLLGKIDAWGEDGTVVWVTAFTTSDPACERHRAAGVASGRTYLEPGQILSMFERYTVLHHHEGLGPEHRHGADLPERHGICEAVLLREFS